MEQEINRLYIHYVLELRHAFMFVAFPKSANLGGISFETWVRNKSQFPRPLVYQFFKIGNGYSILNDDQIFIPNLQAGIEKVEMSEENYSEDEQKQKGRDSESLYPRGLVRAYTGIEERLLDITETYKTDSRLYDFLSILNYLL